MLRRQMLIAAPLFAGLVLVGCANTGVDSGSTRGDIEAGKSRKEVLRVALFPWIPDAADDGFDSLKKRLEEKFEDLNPNIDLELRLKQWDDSYYHPAKIAGWLASGEYDLVEIDTVILGDLVEAEVIEPWPSQDESRFFRAATQGASITAKDGSRTWWAYRTSYAGFSL